MSEWQVTLAGDYYRYENGTARPLTLAYLNNLEAENARLRTALEEIQANMRMIEHQAFHHLATVETLGTLMCVNIVIASRALEPTAEKV